MTARHFGEHHDEIMEVCQLLQETWQRVDPHSNVAKYPTSYQETFLDMARAVVAERHGNGE